MKFAFPSFQNQRFELSRYKSALLKIDLLSLLKGLLLLLLVSFVALLVSLTIVIYPAISVVLITPIFLVAFWLIPQTSLTPPVDKIRRLFYIWLVLTILWPSYVIFEIPGVFDIWPVRLLMLLLVLYGGFYLIKSLQLKARYLEIYNQHHLLFNLLFFYLAFLFLGTFSKGLLDGAPYMFFRELSEVFIPLFIFLVLIRSQERLVGLFNVLIIVATFVVVLGVIESFLEKNIYLSVLPDWMISNQDWVQNSFMEKIRGEYRVQSVFEHPLTMGQFLVLFFPLFAYKYVCGKSIKVKLLSLLMLLLTLYVLFSTGSRSVYIGIFMQLLFFGMLMLYFVLKEKRASFFGWLFTSLSPIVFLTSPLIAWLMKRMAMGTNDSEASSTQARFEMMDKSVNVFRNDPVSLFTGHGSGQAAEVLGYRLPSGFLTIDSYALNILLDSGLIGLLCFIMFFIVVLHLGFKLLDNENVDKVFVIALMVGIVGYLSVALILSQTGNLRLLFLSAFSLILLSYFHKRSDRKKLEL